VGDTAILVVTLSDSFADLWAQFGADLGVSIRLAEADATLPRDCAAIVLAAGGAEREALAWLEASGGSDRVAIFAVGCDPGRRIAAQLVGRGAKDYFALPEDLELLRNALRLAAMGYRQASGGEDGISAPAASAFAGIVGESNALRLALARAGKILPHASATVLIAGETGTGKELLAQAIHHGGPRRDAPFVTVNCAALPSNLIESELFGHERGAFTDAHAAKPGLFEVADGGTLLLDEIDMIPVDLQGKLLRVLENQEVRRVGATKSRRVDVRIVAATHEDLAQRVASGQFRQDLYFRLSVIALALPPLRERGEDVITLATAFLKALSTQHGLPLPALTAEVQRALLAHSWPGNVRELKNAVERMLLLSPPGELNVGELLPDRGVRGDLEPSPPPKSLNDVAASAARSMLATCGGNRSEAARRLRISRQRLRRLLSAAAS